MKGGQKISNFLKHFGFDEIDLKIKLKSIKTGKSENEIREEVAKFCLRRISFSSIPLSGIAGNGV